MSSDQKVVQLADGAAARSDIGNGGVENRSTSAHRATSSLTKGH
jgi:hypothetical protein